CESVVAIGGDRAQLSGAGLQVIPDLYPGEGPLGGIVTALEAAPERVRAVFVASCDLPRLTGAAVHAVLDALLTEDTADVAIAVTHRDQPLCSAWRPMVLPTLHRLFASGERRALSAITDLEVLRVAVPAEVLVNVNTIADLPE
ncbi:MAG: NTP transferase domain-containing protein, partial [Actinomycetota bacterium]